MPAKKIAQDRVTGRQKSPGTSKDNRTDERPDPWNKGRKTGPKPQLKPDQVRQIKLRLRQDQRTRDLAMFCLAIDCKQRASDVVRMTVATVADNNGDIRKRASITQQKTGNDVQFEITDETADALTCWITEAGKYQSDPLFTGLRKSRHTAITTRQLERLMKSWVAMIGLDPMKYGTHSLRRTKVAELYRRTGNLRACQLLLGHTRIESTARYLGVEIDDALTISEAIDL